MNRWSWFIRFIFFLGGLILFYSYAPFQVIAGGDVVMGNYGYRQFNQGVLGKRHKHTLKESCGDMSQYDVRGCVEGYVIQHLSEQLPVAKNGLESFLKQHKKANVFKERIFFVSLGAAAVSTGYASNLLRELRVEALEYKYFLEGVGFGFAHYKGVESAKRFCRRLIPIERAFYCLFGVGRFAFFVHTYIEPKEENLSLLLGWDYARWYFLDEQRRRLRSKWVFALSSEEVILNWLHFTGSGEQHEFDYGQNFKALLL